MRPSRDRTLNIGLIFSFLAFSLIWPTILFILIVVLIIFRILHTQWEFDPLVEGNFVFVDRFNSVCELSITINTSQVLIILCIVMCELYLRVYICNCSLYR